MNKIKTILPIACILMTAYVCGGDLNLVAPLHQTALHKGADAAKSQYKEFFIKHRGDYPFDEKLLNKVGELLIKDGKTDVAIELFKYNVSLYPASAMAYDYLAEGFERAGQLKTALKHYRTAYEKAKAVSDKNTGIYRQHVKSMENRFKLMKLEKSFPVLRGKYLGQTPPTDTMTHFVPEIFFNILTPGMQKELHGGLHFSPAGDELYFEEITRDVNTNKYHTTIMVMKLKDGQWTRPEPASFSGTYKDGTPAFTPDGKRLYFFSSRPSRKESDIWFVEKRGDQWGEPVHLDDAVNSPAEEACPSVTVDGTLYFYRRLPNDKGSGEIFRSRFVNGRFVQAERLDEKINSPDYEVFPIVAPDESVLTYNTLNPSTNGSAIKKSVRGKDGKWTVAKTITGQINPEHFCFSHSFSPDRKYLFIYIRYSAAPQPGDVIVEPGIYWLTAARS